jgi:hypothetical protein
MSDGWAGRVEEAACLLDCLTAVVALDGECGVGWWWKCRGGQRYCVHSCDVGAVMFAGSSKVAEERALGTSGRVMPTG